MKDLILDFLQRKNIQIPKVGKEYEGELTCYVRFGIPKWDFFIYEIDETGDFANALVYSPYTNNIPDHGIIPLKDFVKSYSEEFPSDGFNVYLAIIDEEFNPTPLKEVMRLKNEWQR
ncbi:TPA: hypothetical protein ACPP0Z_001795 [Haemophilus influenzae]|jgi:hypothetical protein|uniref:hypothetical protein n=1 Tax=Haemophilus parainfluenzae TaxID=729 RepID=UPI00066AEAC9|nr:hypothetical protein [Haemophilus parainfluenzae]